MFVFVFRQEEQIKKDEQLARTLQEFERGSPPETIRGSELSQTRETGDQGNEQGWRGQVTCLTATCSKTSCFMLQFPVVITSISNVRVVFVVRYMS